MTTLSPLTVQDVIGFQPSLRFTNIQYPSSMFQPSLCYTDNQYPSSIFQPNLLYPDMEPYPGRQLEEGWQGAEVGHGVRGDGMEEGGELQEVRVDIPNPFGELSETDFASAISAAPASRDLKLQFPENQQFMENTLRTRKVLSKNDFAAALNRVTGGGDLTSEFDNCQQNMEIDYEQPQLTCTLCELQFVYTNKSSLSKHLQSQHGLENQQIVQYYLGKLNVSSLAKHPPINPVVIPSPISKEDAFINSLIDMVDLQVSNDSAKAKRGIPIRTRKPKNKTMGNIKDKPMPKTPRGSWNWSHPFMDREVKSRELRKIVPKPPSYNSDKSNVIQSTYNCDNCEMKFSYIEALDKHTLAHRGQNVGSYKCPHCDDQYFTINVLKVHMNENLMVVAMLCGINGCEARFMARCEGSRHQREEHGLQGKKIKLDNKAVILSPQPELETNPGIQPEAPPPVNFEMSVDFGQETNIETGTKMPTGTEQIKSSLEGTEFVIEETEESGIPTNMDAEMLPQKFRIGRSERQFVETGDPARRFGCVNCEKAYKTSSHLLDHMVQHTGVYPFKCATCKKGFLRKGPYLGHGCPQTDTQVNVLSQTDNKEQTKQDVSETKMQEELSVEEVETQELLEMPGGVGLPMDNIDMSLDGDEFVIPDPEDSQEMSLEGVEFVIQENEETQDCDTPRENKGSDKQELETEHPTTLIDSEQNIPTVPEEIIQDSKGNEVHPERPASQPNGKPSAAPVQYNCVLCTACYATKDEFKVHFESHQDSIPEGLKKAYRKTSIQEPKVLDIHAARQMAKQIEETSLNTEVMLKKAQEGKSRSNVGEKPSAMREPKVIDIMNIKQVAREIEERAALRETASSPKLQTKTVIESKKTVADLTSSPKEKKTNPAKNAQYSCSLFKFKCVGHASLKDHISDTIQ